ncbi:hypothetical protein [Nostoc sp.]|uniref:hypothetical protein n=1 Tax=Nostoc sp. TaxID=1180 RepID=UPI002FFD12D2
MGNDLIDIKVAAPPRTANAHTWVEMHKTSRRGLESNPDATASGFETETSSLAFVCS